MFQKLCERKNNTNNKKIKVEFISAEFSACLLASPSGYASGVLKLV